MKISLSKKYKSLKPFDTEELPFFTIIIGKNGSGKSQLVQKFNQLSKSKTPKEFDASDFKITPSLSRIYSDTLIIDNIQSSDPTNYRNQIKALHQLYTQGINDFPIRKAWSNLYKKATEISIIKNIKVEVFDDIYDFKELLSHDDVRFVESDIEHVLAKVAKGYTTILLFSTFLKNLKASLEIFEASIAVAKSAKKDILDLEESDFFNAIIPDKFLYRGDLITSKIEDIFYSFLRRRDRNSYLFFKKSSHKKDNESISSTDFNTLYIDPIIQINEILTVLHFPYYFKAISEEDFSPEVTTHFDFIKKGSEAKIQVGDLSSGEKIILSLIIKLFTSEFYKSDLKFPELIIIDEPDAHLHPEMSKILIDVLNGTFVNKIGIKVIITTHSPTTVALAPEESIFQLNNEPETFLRKIAKDDALKILTSGLPNLSIDYKNHRQIFVESPTDLDYYQSLFNKLNSDIKQPYNLYFIANGYGQGNCDQVIKIVKDLRTAGNTSSYGVIDWDKKNSDKQNIYVHGFDKRYTIENYIFDPIYISILLIKRNYGLLKAAIKFGDIDNEYDLIKTEKAQNAIDYITKELEPRNSNLLGFDRSLKTHYYGIYHYKIPAWYTNLQGHDLKQQLMDHFPPLENISRAGDHELEKALINIIGKMYPNVPVDTLDLLKKIAS